MKGCRIRSSLVVFNFERMKDGERGDVKIQIEVKREKKEE